MQKDISLGMGGGGGGVVSKNSSLQLMFVVGVQKRCTFTLLEFYA